MEIPTAQCLDVEESQGGSVQANRLDCELPLLEQMYLVLPYVVLVETIRTLAEIASEIFNDSHIRLDCGFREITTLEFFQHTLTQIGHVGLLWPTRYVRSLPSWVCHAIASAASAASFKRRRVYRSLQVQSGKRTDT